MVLSADSCLSALDFAECRITARPNASNAGLTSAMPVKGHTQGHDAWNMQSDKDIAHEEDGRCKRRRRMANAQARSYGIAYTFMQLGGSVLMAQILFSAHDT